MASIMLRAFLTLCYAFMPGRALRLQENALFGGQVLRRNWWVFSHLEGGEIWGQAVREEGLNPSTISEFGRKVPKYPRSVVTAIMKLNHTKVRNYHFAGSFCWESENGTSSFGEQCPPDIMLKNREWARDMASRFFRQGDIFRAIDIWRCKDPWTEMGSFDQSMNPPSGYGVKFMNLSADRKYLEDMVQTRVVLCPAGEEPWSTRMFETALVESLPMIRSRQADVCPWANDNLKALQYVQNLYRAITVDEIDTLPERQDWVHENFKTFIKYQTFMEGDNQPENYPENVANGPVPQCAKPALAHYGIRKTGRAVLLIIVGLKRSLESSWLNLERDFVKPTMDLGYTFKIVVHTSLAESPGATKSGIKQLFSEYQHVTVIDKEDHCEMLTPNMVSGEKCQHKDLPGIRHISCGTVRFASRAVDALKPYLADSQIDKVLVVRTDRHLVPDPPPKYSYVAPGHSPPVRAEPVKPGWFNIQEACDRFPGVNIIGSAQYTNGFAANHDPDWAWMLCDPSQIALFRDALAAAGLPCDDTCRTPPRTEQGGDPNWVRCDRGWCKTAALLEGRIRFGTLAGYALASI